MPDEQKIVKPGDGDDQGNEELIKEPVYVVPPHPVGAAPLSNEAASPGEPVAVQDSLPELIQQAVEGLRSELKAEMEAQVRELQSDLQAELQKELKGGSELNVKG